jgi:membrane fusion protein, heavy metal efflux system
LQPHPVSAFAFALSAALAITSCSVAHSSTAESPSGQNTSRQTSRDPNEITPRADLLKQLRVGEPQHADVSDTLEIPGRIEANEGRLSRVSSPVSGRITELHAVEGQVVHRGDVLANLYSTDLSLQQFVLIKDLTAKQVAERAVRRARQLLDAEVIGSAELQRRESELLQANAEVASARDQLRLLGMSPESIDSLESSRAANSQGRILATVDGTVMERKVTLGQVVQPSDTAFVICDLSTVWLVADIPEQAAGHIRVGKEVQAEVASFPGKVISGQVSFVSAVVNPETRTVRARMDLPNQAGLYKPDMLAVVRLRDLPSRRTVIPTSAIVRENNEDFVFVRERPGTFSLRRVTLGIETGDKRVLLDGIAPGESVVLDGAFHLNNERKREATEAAAS